METQVNVPTTLLVSFGPSYTSLLNVGYTLKNLDGSTSPAPAAPRSTANITNSGSGYYATVLTFSQTWNGYIEWDSPSVPPPVVREDITVLPAAVSDEFIPIPLSPSTNKLNESYTTGLKKEIVGALKPAIQTKIVSDAIGRPTDVTWEYPRTAAHYPTIYISYTEGSINNMGLGHYEEAYDSNLTPYRYNHWEFTGQINYNILTLNPADRDSLAAALVTILGPGERVPEFKVFYDEIDDADYILIEAQKNVITPGGFTTGDVPWQSPDEQTFAASYHQQIHGEFFTDPSTGDLIQISAVELYPYLQGHNPPW
jgi:hypothetical protein